MYSVLLMAALTAPPTTQGHCFHGHRGHGGHGCYSCYSCFGCSYYGYSGHGCYWGGACYGCYGCGWCYGGYGSYGCYHNCAWSGGPHHGVLVCHGCYGCYGGYSCYGMPSYGYVQPAGPSGPPATQPRPPEARPSKGETTPPPKESLEQARARITIDVPADAKLFIDGQLTKSTSTRRTFQTPGLKTGSTYFYDVRVEVVRDGKVVSENQRVVLRPGEEATASFASLGQDSPPATAQRAEE